MKSTHIDELSVALIQPDTLWENKEDNLNHLTSQIDKLIDEHPVADIIALPEMFTTGFTMNPTLMAETMAGATIEWMLELAAEKEVAICGSLIIEENKYFYNRFVFINPQGNIYKYDKKHLFAFAGEHENYKAGQQKITIEYKGWKINPFVCYDLRFPVWCRNTDNADIIIYVANWPEIRISHWEKLIEARAIENQCYVIGVNRIGMDFNKIKYPGSSRVCDPLGQIVGALENQAGYLLVKLKKSVLNDIKQKLPFLNDRDEFKLS